MPTLPLPADPSFENLKKRAKQLLRDVRAGDPESLAWVAEVFPREAPPPAAFSLHDAQWTVARAS